MTEEDTIETETAVPKWRDVTPPEFHEQPPIRVLAHDITWGKVIKDFSCII